MYIEYCLYDLSANEHEVKETIAQALKYSVDGISVFPAYIKSIKSLLGNDINLSCPIDYPMGLLDLKSRMIATEQAIKNGAKTIDILCPSVPLCNRKYDRFREDIKTIKDICLQNNVDLRYFLEYRIYSYELLYKMAQILCDFGVTTAFPSTGYFLDDIHDNILATALINKKNSNINIIVNGNIWNKKHLDMIKKANLYGIRVNSLNGLKLLTDQNN
jgi:deoxyribose-phosphate aldolase